MRPLLLRIEGLRSYRKPVDLDFTDKGLFAIIGKTGAGKSSILEAIFFALYGGATYNLGAPRTLIADGVPFARVALTFIGQGRRWRVVRTLPRTGAPRHELICLDQPDVRFDNKTTVSAQISTLIGLTAHQFLKTVLLPQGRFQEFLHAETSVRTPILKTLLGLDTLTGIGELSTAAVNRIKPGLAALEARLNDLPADPAALAAAHAQAARDAGQRHDRLAKAEADIRNLRSTVTDAERRASDLARISQQLAGLHPTDGPATIRSLIAAAQTHDALAVQQQDRTKTALQRREQLSDLVRDADRDGRGLEQSLTLQALIEPTQQRAEELRDSRTQQQTQKSALDETGRRLDNRTQKSAELADASQRAKTAFDDAGTAHEIARLARQNAAAAISRLRDDRAGIIKLSAELTSKEGRLSALSGQIDTASLLIAQRTRERDSAQQQYDIGIRALDAQHLAAQCRPGDACPVCQRALTDSFTPPKAADHQLLEQARTDAAAALQSATSEHGRLTGSAQTLTATVADLRTQLSTRTNRHTTSTHEVALVLSRQDLDFDLDDETLLSVLDNHVAVTLVERQAAESQYLGAALTASNAASSLAADRTAHTAALKAHGKQAAILDQQWNKLQTTLGDLGLSAGSLDELNDAMFVERATGACQDFLGGLIKDSLSPVPGLGLAC